MDRQITKLSSGWKFHYGDEEEAWYKGYDDSAWENVIVPHDWSVHMPFSREYSSGTGYLAGGIGGNLLSLAVSMKTGSYAVSAGASGAIFSVIGALLYIALRNRGTFGERNMKKLVFMVVLMIMQGTVDKGVDGSAHLGGLISGFLLGILLYHQKRSTKYERL